ncbi:MAG TPA: septum formation initiator family protein [Thermoanaerobaculia bacterium]|nr:septum formation initiator family protein [Thermoanaerobaculia bacterium]
MRSHSPTASPKAPTDRAPRLRPLGVGVALFLLALFLIAGFKTWRDLAVVERREAELESSIASARGDIRELELRLERIAGDPAVLERLAREELAMTYPDEIVVLLPDESSEAPRRAPRQRPGARSEAPPGLTAPVDREPAAPAAPPPPARR